MYASTPRGFFILQFYKDFKKKLMSLFFTAQCVLIVVCCGYYVALRRHCNVPNRTFSPTHPPTPPPVQESYGPHTVLITIIALTVL